MILVINTRALNSEDVKKGMIRVGGRRFEVTEEFFVHSLLFNFYQFQNSKLSRKIEACKKVGTFFSSVYIDEFSVKNKGAFVCFFVFFHG